MMTENKIHDSFEQLKQYCVSNGFKGYDPYDGLNSRLFRSLPVLPRIGIVRLAWIQFFKRSPLNLRKLVGIKKEYNPKALGLFLSAYCLMYKNSSNKKDLETIHFLTEKIFSFRSDGYSGDCWGYNFDWESRAFFQPKNTPTIVASSFIANALMDAYEVTGEKRLLESARSTCHFFMKDLNRNIISDNEFAFSYSPLDHSIVYNASLLGASLMSRVYAHTKEEILTQEAAKIVQYCCHQQHADGSWSYGTLPFHQWIDSFHTGYNLECIAAYMKYTGDNRFQSHLEKGFQYYINTFFTEEGIPKYYSDSIYPIDIHAPSQLIITLQKLGKFSEYQKLAEKVLGWTIQHMQSPKGYFFYQINKYFTSRIPYMRWSQAWMFLSLTVYLQSSTPKQHQHENMV